MKLETEDQYQAALAELDPIFFSTEKDEETRAEELMEAILEYERIHFPIDMTPAEIKWSWKDYTFRANFEGLLLVVNENNHNWMIQSGNEIVANGTGATLEERKTMALCAAIELEGEAGA